MKLAGVHCHLGSTIKQLEPIRDCAKRLNEIVTQIRPQIQTDQPIINVGGGLGIKYNPDDSDYPSVNDYVSCFSSIENSLLIFEPGRSLVGNTGILIGQVIGIKNDNCLVTDLSMTECIRPALYDAYHHVTPVCLPDKENQKENLEKETKSFKVVGPVCESADFVNKSVALPPLQSGDLIALWDVGAYCSVLGSNYNMRGRRGF